MITDLAELRRSVELPLEYPEAGTLKQQAELALSWLLQYQESVPEQPAGRVGSRKELDALLAGPAPEEGQGFRSAFEEFQQKVLPFGFRLAHPRFLAYIRSEEHTSELQSRQYLVCRLLLEKKTASSRL